MALVSVGLAIGHVRAVAGDEDELIQLYLGAAEQSAQDYLNRKVYATQVELEADQAAGTAGANPMVVNDAIKAAVLKTVADLYDNRGDSVVGYSVAELPLTAKALLRPHRIPPGL